jgi:hypothetical protein
MSFDPNRFLPQYSDPDKIADYKKQIADLNRGHHGIVAGDEGEPIGGFAQGADFEESDDVEETPVPQNNIGADFRSYLENNDLLTQLKETVPPKALYPTIKNALMSIAGVLKKDIGLIAKAINKTQLAKLLSLNVKDELTCWEYTTQFGTLYFVLSYTSLKRFYLVKPNVVELVGELNLSQFSDEALYLFVVSGIIECKELKSRHSNGTE